MKSPLNKLFWIEELLPSEVEPKKMFGGVGYYIDERLMLILIEASKTREHKGRAYPFEIWNGCLFPIEKMKQNTVFAKFTFLENHPAKKNCLYLPAETEEFEEKIRLVMREINKRNPLFGAPFKESAADKRKRLNVMNDESNQDLMDEEMDTRKPSLFNLDVPRVKKATVPQRAPAKKPKKKTSKKIKADKKSENAFILSLLKRK